jgi:hypothetical protein
MPYTAGIYVFDTPDGSYVGQSSDIRKRIGRHVADLEQRKHKNLRLQSVYDRIRKQQLEHSVGSNDEEDLYEFEEISVKVQELAPITLTGDALTTWLLRREAYWMQWMREANRQILNVAPPELPPFDCEGFHDKQKDVEQKIKRFPGEMLSLQHALSKIEEHTRAEIILLEPKILEANQSERRAQSKRWLFVGLILAVGLIASSIQQDYFLFGLSAVVAAWLVFFGPRFNDAALEEQRRLYAEQQKIEHALKSKQGEIKHKKKELGELKNTLRRFKEEETIFFAE